MAVVADAFSGLLVFVFGSAAVAKLLRQKQHVQTAARMQLPWDRYRWNGVPEAAARVGLLVGYAGAQFGAAAPIGLAILMAGALVLRLRIHDSAGYLLGDA